MFRCPSLCPHFLLGHKTPHLVGPGPDPTAASLVGTAQRQQKQHGKRRSNRWIMDGPGWIGAVDELLTSTLSARERRAARAGRPGGDVFVRPGTHGSHGNRV